ncbi:MAG TPA: glutamate ABC transporter substrate-binding protein [Pseudonocardiaceae bacterium]|nr:glutamate ABC transporter substrate-binding protein [Pseudonocardiaceae bacterium]
MRFRTLTVGLLVGGLTLAACGGTPSNSGTGAPPTTTESISVASGVSVPGSATFDRIRRNGTITVGVKDDQPGIGIKDPITGEYSGFDIEIAKLVAAKLGLSTDRIKFTPIQSAAREAALGNGQVDLVVASYTINDKRKAQVSFAGPYFVAGQSLLVRKDDNSITGKNTLKGKKVCSVTGSTPIQRVRDQGLTEPSNIVELSKYSDCVNQLEQHSVDVLTTDDAILKGYAALEPDKLKVVGQPFSTEPYGIGLAHDDAALRGKIDDILQQALNDGTWQRLYNKTLGQSGVTTTKPVLQRY